MHVTPVEWIVTIVVIAGLFAFDFVAHVRKPHEPSFRESAFWYVLYVTLAVLFGVFVALKWDTTYGGE